MMIDMATTRALRGDAKHNVCIAHAAAPAVGNTTTHNDHTQKPKTACTMAVDEFGREIQGAPSSNSYHHHHSNNPSSPRPRSRSYGNNDDHRHHRPSVSPSPNSYTRRRRRRGRHHDDADDHIESSSRSSLSKSRHRSYSRDDGRGSSKQSRKHPSEEYAAEPMLCQYVWEQQLAAARKLEQRDDVNAAKKNDGEEAAATSNNEPSEELSSSPPLFSTPEEASKAYLEYNTKYCLNYVRTFFNAHLDDGWFRLHLSPGARYQRALSRRKDQLFRRRHSRAVFRALARPHSSRNA